MAFSKANRIKVLLAIDCVFFVLEIAVGYAAHSLALVADSFHMLNDVLSLCVGLWAVKVANERPSSTTFTYGWVRAETLGALVNGVFLVALCLTIFLEAIQRFVEPQEVRNPKLVLIVGCFGLLSNILGLFLFHDLGHSHSHDEPEHEHGVSDSLVTAEEGYSSHEHEPVAGTKRDAEDMRVQHAELNTEDTMPESNMKSWISSRRTPTTQTTAVHRPSAITFANSSEATAVEDRSASFARNNSMSSRRTGRSRRSGSRSYDDIPIHPASLRNDIINQARLKPEEDSSSSEESEDDQISEEIMAEPSETSPLQQKTSRMSSYSSRSKHRHTHSRSDGTFKHSDHNHANASAGGHGGHSHEDMNMKGIFLHVLGDALGNVGVIASALIIWLTTWPLRFYADPTISLIITLIILKSAIPLCKASSKILLQATPQHISVDEIKEDIEDLPRILSAHHVHVWQLTPSKLVASMHVQVGFDFQGEGAARYMELARAMRNCLHGYGIHSSTIQPEFCVDPKHEHECDEVPGPGDPSSPSTDETVVASKTDGPRKRRAHPHASEDESCGFGACLLECGDACGSNKQCCAPGSTAGSGTATPKKHGDGDSH